MRPIIKIAKTELQKLFYSPVAWMILVLFTFQVASLFTHVMGNAVLVQRMRSAQELLTWRIFSSKNDGGIFPGIVEYVYLYIPLLTMSIMSRELGSGSIKLLYSSPVTNRQIILGKYLALMLFAGIMTAIVLVFGVYAGITIDQAEWAHIACGLLGVYLLIGTYAAIGLFMSSLTSYAVVAAIATLAMLAVLGYVGKFGQEIALVRDITYWLSMNGRVNTFISGLITSEDLLYFPIVIGLFLCFTIIKLQSGRQKASVWVTLGKYAGIFLVAMVLGYLTALPKLKAYTDVTYTQMNTLSNSSQAVMRKLPYGLKIHTYVNMLDPNTWIALPSQYKTDVARFKQYARFKPEIEFDYTYYWHKADNPYLDKRYPGLTDAQRLDSLKLSGPWEFDIEPYRKDIAGASDLSTEDYRFVRVLESSNGKRTFLRVFNDPFVLPFEPEITAAMKRLTDDIPIVGFVTGQGERSVTDDRERGYAMVTAERTFRNSLLNNGFDVQQLTLDAPVPTNTHILVIAELKSALTPAQQANLQAYIDRGDNLLIAGEPKRQEAMNAVTMPLGVKLLPGQLVQSSATLDPSVAIAQVSPDARSFSHYIDDILEREAVLPVSGGAGLELLPNSPFTAIPIMQTDSTGWNELQTTDLVDDSATVDVASGEARQPYTVMAALSRKIGSKEQRIVVTGDADWLSNGELRQKRPGFRPANFMLLQATFHWLTSGELPIDMRHRPSKDNTLKQSKSSWDIWAVVLKWGLPGILLIAAILIWVRRRGR